MGIKEDWEEIEKWQKEYETKKQMEYGSNGQFPKFREISKKTKKIVKFFDALLWGISYLTIGLLILFTIIVAIKIIGNWG